MPLAINGVEIRRVQIVDDDPAAREAYSYAIEELELEPIPVDGPIRSLGGFIERVQQQTDAVICDHRLQTRTYAHFTGAETASQLYQRHVPVILYTRYEDIMYEIRPYRRHIPVLLNPDEVNLDSLTEGFRQCVAEFRGELRSSRRAWRTLVRVEDVNEERQIISVVVPGWDPGKVISLPMYSLPRQVLERLNKQIRFHALVNIGAEHHEELFFDEWEPE